VDRQLDESLDAARGAVHWSRRQRQVLDLLVQGKSNQQIADSLSVSLDGAKWHLREIFAKLGVDSREQAADYWWAQNRLPTRLRRRLRLVTLLTPRWIAALGVGSAAVVTLIVIFALRDLGLAETVGPTLPVATGTAAVRVTGVPTMLLIDWPTSVGVPGKLRPIDPATGADLPGFVAVPQAGNAWLSPQGDFVAAFIYPTQSSGAAVHLIDVSSWIDTAVSPTPTDISAAVWAPDDARFYYFTGVPGSPQVLHAVEVASRTTKTLGDIDVLPTQPAVSPDGRTLYALGVPTGADYVANGDPELLAIDTATGSLRSSLAFPGLPAGQRHTGAGYASYQPALVLSPDGATGYVVDADSNAISVVDLNVMRVRQTVVARAPRSLLHRFSDGLGDLFVSDAQAKDNNSKTRRAILSAGGRYLWISGENDENCDSNLGCTPSPAGLRVIDTTNFSVVYRADGIALLEMNADARTIVGTGFRFSIDPKGDFSGLSGPGILVFDAFTPGTVWHNRDGLGYSSLTLSTDGEYAILQSYFRDDSRPCGSNCSRLTFVDISKREVLHETDWQGWAPSAVGR
jgi:DNA-binding CsgD family transcriptional regulator/DNA-binding beta-propeller fold protein YncE